VEFISCNDESILDLPSEVKNASKKIGHPELCIHAEELDMLKQLASFLMECETSQIWLVQPILPHLSFHLRNSRLGRCAKLSLMMTQGLKNKVAANVSHRLKSNEAAKIQHIIDPDTKGIVARDMAAALLLATATKCSERGIISLEDEPGTILLKSTILH
jgi:hypothetical protein